MLKLTQEPPQLPEIRDPRKARELMIAYAKHADSARDIHYGAHPVLYITWVTGRGDLKTHVGEEEILRLANTELKRLFEYPTDYSAKSIVAELYQNAPYMGDSPAWVEWEAQTQDLETEEVREMLALWVEDA